MNYKLLLFSSLIVGLINLNPVYFSDAELPISPEAITICRPLQNNTLTINSIRSGVWNDPNTWSTGTVPTSVDNVSISANTTISISGNITANSITVAGILRPQTSNTAFTLNTKGIMVMGNTALFEIGTPATPYTGSCSITLTGSNSSEVLFSGMGTKVIGAMDGGTIRFEGLNKTSWTRLASTVNVGSNTITLMEPLNWQVGDEIVITSSRENWNEAEKRIITAKSTDNKTFTLNNALAYPHVGSVNTYTRSTDNKTWTADLRAEVGLLTHNIKIQGDAASNTSGFGGHVMVHSSGKAFVSGVELYRMGQKAKQGRYPMHWHMLATDGQTQFIKNSSIHQSFNRAVTIHGTHGITVDNNFMYDHIGHGVFLENGSEINNIITKNVVLLTKRPASGEQLTLSDNQSDTPQNRTPASFWITNPNNYFSQNVSAGTEGTGFWYALAQDFMFESKNDPRFAFQTKPYKEVFGGFSGNTSHSCMNGFDIFDQLNADHGLIVNDGWDEPNLKYFTDNTFYANWNGIYGGVGWGRELSKKVIFSNCAFIENRHALFLANYSVIDQSLFVANTGYNLVDGVKYFYEVYDGPATVRNSHFVGWDASNTTFFLNVGGAVKHPNHIFENITFNHLGPPKIDFSDFLNFSKQRRNYNFDQNKPESWGAIFRDKTGSISGHTDYSTIGPIHILLEETMFIPYFVCSSVVAPLTSQ
jgi:cell surface hyaluronidase